jgi:hypothetical protein
MRLLVLPILAVACLAAVPCDLSQYRPQPGLHAKALEGGVVLEWQGAGNVTLRSAIVVRNGQPVISELVAGKAVLGHHLRPEFDVTTGIRRISEQQLAPLRKLGMMDPAFLDSEKWKAFWDAPINVGLKSPVERDPAEIRRATVTYEISGCVAKTDGARLEVTFPGATLGLFSSGSLVFTVYRGTNLLRQELVAKTEQQSVAYKYGAGLKGFAIEDDARITWRDTARGWQKYEFGGAVNHDQVALQARNRLAIVENKQGSLVVFPPPHKFFWAREIELNLGYVWYRKDSESSFSAGIRQADHEGMYRPYGVSDEQWKKRSDQSRNFIHNFALYNAPPGTWQRMAVYYYLSPEGREAAQRAVMAFTHDDTYVAMPGRQVAVSHFHTHFHEFLEDAGSIDVQPSWLAVFRSLGINIAMMSDFHGDGHPTDPGPLRLKEQQTYFEGCRRHSDRDFLIMPGEEPDANFGGHYTMVFPRPVYWTKVRQPGQAFEENSAPYGKVYHAGSPQEELDMLQREGGLIWQAHPRTKGSAGYPDGVREAPHFRSDRFLGASFQSLPVDLSEQRLCESRCFGTLDDMNNWADPKYLIGEGDTYAKYPEDDTYEHLYVNYVKLAKVPKFDEDWSPILKAMRAGDFFVTSGEILLHNVSLERDAVVADLEYTFPLEFVEVVWGDGDKTGRTIVRATELLPFGRHTFHIPFNASGQKWVRFAAWDSAGNGAFSQPTRIAAP